MKRIAIAAASTFAAYFTVNAQAADIVETAPAQTIQPTADWSGFYFGVHGGYGAFSVEVDESDVTGPLGPFTVDEQDMPDGALGGVSLGYAIQSGSWVYGAEADFSFADVEGSQDSTLALGGPARTEVELDWLATLRGRIGYLPNDRLLVYGTAGLAVAHVTEVADFGMAGRFVNDNTHVGLAVGGGAEWMLSDRISARAEALYVHLSEETYGSLVPADAHGFGIIGRIGLGVRF